MADVHTGAHSRSHASRRHKMGHKTEHVDSAKVREQQFYLYVTATQG